MQSNFVVCLRRDATPGDDLVFAGSGNATLDGGGGSDVLETNSIGVNKLVGGTGRSDAVAMSPQGGSHETNFVVQETILASWRKQQETNTGQAEGDDEQWSSVMSAILTLIYREYCKARLAEMQKHRLGG